jgi:hypothetical protein
MPRLWHLRVSESSSAHENAEESCVPLTLHVRVCRVSEQVLVALRPATLAAQLGVQPAELSADTIIPDEDAIGTVSRDDTERISPVDWSSPRRRRLMVLRWVAWGERRGTTKAPASLFDGSLTHHASWVVNAGLRK